MSTLKAMPQTIFVTLENSDTEDAYLATSETLDGAFDATQDTSEPIRIGEYQLVRICSVKRELKIS